MITITNDFHNTEYRTRKTGAEIAKILDTAPWDRSPKDQKWVSRVRRALCGSNKDCKCGQNDIKARGWGLNYEEE